LGALLVPPAWLRPFFLDRGVKEGHFPGTAKRVILVFSSGGVSHLETWDPKPELAQQAGKSWEGGHLLTPRFPFRKAGECGTEISEILPNLAKQADRLCVVRSMYTDHGNHVEAALAMHTGSTGFATPSLGSWVYFGLGSQNSDLPGFVVLSPRLPYSGMQAFSACFLPAYFQGVRFSGGPEPVGDLRRKGPTRGLSDLEQELRSEWNRRHAENRPEVDELLARDLSFQTASRMSRAVPEVFDLNNESDQTLAEYGLARGQREGFGWQCLMARRLSERGVRFVEVTDVGTSKNWDSHGDMAVHATRAEVLDRPLAALIEDLHRRDLLQETLVIWATEFGRSPKGDANKDPAKGRGHHREAFSILLAGGGIQGGQAFGETDEVGARVVRDPVHVHDLHATVLHLLGLDHERLTFHHAGRDHRLTDVYGKVVRGLLA
jgi:hypothetical protein